VQAARWVAENRISKGDALKTEVDKQGWDESIKSLTQPRCAEDDERQAGLDTKLGDAVLAQQTDVMDPFNGCAPTGANNKFNRQKQKVKRNPGRQTYIIIEPTDRKPSMFLITSPVVYVCVAVSSLSAVLLGAGLGRVAARPATD
jgi:hypothetical protein